MITKELPQIPEIRDPLPLSFEAQRFSFGGITFLLEAPGMQVEDWPHPFYTPFLSQLPADITIRVNRLKSLPPKPNPKNLLFDSTENLWHLYKERKGYRLELRDTKTKQRDRVIFISKDFSKAEVSVTRLNWSLQRLVRPLLDFLVVNYLAPRRGLLFHAAAVRDHEKGYLFVGHSGAGKTTMSRFWKDKIGDVQVLGDERIVVRQFDEGWRVCGTPWPGLGFRVSRDSPFLKQLFVLKQAKQNKVLEMPKPILFQELFGQIFSTFWDATIMNQISETCENLIQDVSSHQLASIRSPKVTDFIHEYANRNQKSFV